MTTRKLLVAVGVTAAVLGATALAFEVSPWPGALAIRAVFDAEGRKTLRALQPFTPTTPITILANQEYLPGVFLDIYIPPTSRKLPTVIWTHGGAWIAGSKDHYTPYFKLLASYGFIVVAPNYTLGPEAQYPTALQQLNTACAYALTNPWVDGNNVFLSGDSAGAQLTSQLATLITNPSYAQELNITPALRADQVKGVALWCGIYNLQKFTEVDPRLPKILGWGSEVAVWAYTGSRSKTSLALNQMSTLFYVTSQFPPTFISGGNGDPLTATQSQPLAARLQELQVPVTTHFFPADHTPSLPHEYQFTLGADGWEALQALVTFLRS